LVFPWRLSLIRILIPLKKSYFGPVTPHCRLKNASVTLVFEGFQGFFSGIVFLGMAPPPMSMDRLTELKQEQEETVVAVA